ncbi:MAG: CinA family protein, partial [Bacteroidia bacterium]
PSYIKLAYLPGFNVVRLRLTGISDGKVDIHKEVNAFADRIKERVLDALVSEEDLSMAELVFQLLEKKGKTISVAESCTGGYISHLLTMIPGVSKVFVGSVVSYSNSVKHHQLGVENTLFETVGAVSEQVVTEMAAGVRERLETDYSIAVSGVAGPGGGSIEKPVGTVYISVSSKNKSVVKRFQFNGDRMNVIARSANLGFDLLRRLILEND